MYGRAEQIGVWHLSQRDLFDEAQRRAFLFEVRVFLHNDANELSSFMGEEVFI
jgi:hypothetical protein